MGMVTARRGEHVVKVSRKTFENSLSKVGYVECGYVETQPTPDLSAFDIDVNEEKKSDTVDAISTTPISEMNKEMLLQYAELNGIDLQDATTVRDIRKVIQEHVKASKMQ